MGWSLRAGLSFCSIGDRLLFLDVPRDRYFCLGAEIDGSFRRLCADRSVPGDAERLSRAKLIVVGQRDEAPRPCVAPACSGESLLDQPQPASRPIDAARAAIALTLTATHLRCAGLAAAFDRITRLKASMRHAAPTPGAVQRAIAGFVSSRLWFDDHDRCLLRSLALAHRLVAIGASPTIILGVKLQPFGAHCWVQIDRRLANDRIDIIRTYTPILTL